MLNNLYSVVQEIEIIADEQPNINTIIKTGNIYDLNDTNNVIYGAFCLTQQQHYEEDGFMHYRFYLYYVDRLLDGKDNKIEIQSTAISTLSNIVRTLLNGYDVEIERITYQTFEQKFNDLCAGAYADIEIVVPIEDNCVEEF